MKGLIFSIAIALFSTAALATDGAGLVKAGLEAYKAEGASAAIDVWLKGGGLEGSKAAISQVGAFTQVESYYGRLEGYEIARVHDISERSQMILYVMHFHNGPAYGRFQAFKKSDGTWVATEFKIHTEAAAVWPGKLVFGQSM